MSAVRVLIVDDSPTMRAVIEAALKRDPDIEVVGSAGDPLEAREAIKALNPDVLTLDIEMPNMDGLAFLEKIMRLRPMPVVMVSTLTQRGADATLRALEIGAVDCVAKPTSLQGADGALADLAHRVKCSARANVRPRTPTDQPRAPRTVSDPYEPDGSVIAIGASTGGVEALLELVSALPANCAPVVITQHMPASFTGSFAARLDRGCAAQVAEAYDGAPLSPGKVWLAPGGATHLEVVARSSGHHCRLRTADPVSGHRPSVDVLMNTVSDAAGERAVGVILTGMGRDGAAGLQRLHEAGGRTLGQDEATCIVYGMPKAAFQLGAVQRQLPIHRIGSTLVTMTNRRS